MSEEKKDSVTAASLPIDIAILLVGFQNLEWYTLGVRWSLASPKLVPFGAVIPIFRWAHQVDPLEFPSPAAAARAKKDLIARAKIVKLWTSARHAFVKMSSPQVK